MKYSSGAKLQMKPAESTVVVVKDTSSPMMAWGEGDGDISDFQRLPSVQFVNPIKSKVLHQVPHTVRDDDGLKCRDPSESSPVQMVEMGVSNEHQVNCREMMQLYSGTPDTFDDLEPEGPTGVHQNIQSAPAN